MIVTDRVERAWQLIDRITVVPRKSRSTFAGPELAGGEQGVTRLLASNKVEEELPSLREQVCRAEEKALRRKPPLPEKISGAGSCRLTTIEGISKTLHQHRTVSHSISVRCRWKMQFRRLALREIRSTAKDR
jgi:hypothetical protein